MEDDAFSADWLTLREPVDHRSRATALLAPLRDRWEGEEWRRILDLGSGTGSNLRYLAPRLRRARSGLATASDPPSSSDPASPPDPPQRWTLLDRDPTLLERVPPPPEGVTLATVVGDLAQEGLELVQDADLVTASALLDLVPESWVEALALRCARQGAGALLALSYDGTIRWSEADPDDGFIREAVNRHQGIDKGLGPAMGPAAARTAERHFQAVGYQTWLLPSPWELGSPGTGRPDGPLAGELVRGWAAAAREVHPDEAHRIQAWAARREDAVAGGGTRLTVGHLDLLALPHRD